MPILEAENAFKKGLCALVRQEAAQATVFFAHARSIERERGATPGQMRYVSYWGLSVALAERPTTEAIRACELAAATDAFNPDLQLNLGKVYLLAGKVQSARAAFLRGAGLAPEHPGLRKELARLEERGPALLPFAQRKRLERTLGALRAGLSALAGRLRLGRSAASF